MVDTDWKVRKNLENKVVRESPGTFYCPKKVKAKIGVYFIKCWLSCKLKNVMTFIRKKYHNCHFKVDAQGNLYPSLRKSQETFDQILSGNPDICDYDMPATEAISCCGFF